MVQVVHSGCEFTAFGWIGKEYTPTLFRLAIYNVYDVWKAKARGLCGKGQLGIKLHDVNITGRTEKY